MAMIVDSRIMAWMIVLMEMLVGMSMIVLAAIFSITMSVFVLMLMGMGMSV